MAPSAGFIGGGRITRIFLGGWKRSGGGPSRVVVSDTDAKPLGALAAAFPEIVVVRGDNLPPASQQIVFLALHPPVLRTVLSELRGRIPPASLVISLAPRLTIAEIAQGLGGHGRVARMIPNAPSVVGTGFNPVCFSPGLTDANRRSLDALLSPLGAHPEVPESDLEAYALLTAMGPTYLWFQLYELLSLAESFGLDRAAASQALGEMVTGAVRAMTDSGLSAAEVMDLIPARPLSPDEDMIKNAYRARLTAVFDRIRPPVTV